MRNTITFLLDGSPVEIDFSREKSIRPTTTVLDYLRSLPSHRGVKEGCAEGDCGACTVVIAAPSGDGGLAYRAVDSCLLFLPMIDGKQLITVEDLRSPDGALHPVQEALVAHHGSQCGFCTPGFVMSMFALYKSSSHPSRADVEDALTGNLCRCTGYRPIVDAAMEACARGPRDHFTVREKDVLAALGSLPRGDVEIRTGMERYYRPESISNALDALRKFPDATVISGATDAALRVTKRQERLGTVIDLGALEELRGVGVAAGVLQLGAGIPLADVAPVLRENFPALAETLSVFASRQIRNCATLGGNLGTASPIGDTAPVLVAYGARVVLQSYRGVRTLPLDGFFTGYRKTLREPDELIVAVHIPAPDGAFVRSYKVSRRRDLDIATLSAGFRLEKDGTGSVRTLTLAYGGMAERTKRASNTEQFLVGKRWSRETVEEAAGILPRDFRPITDVRGSAEFRMAAAKNLLLRFWLDSKG
ncbi:MAG TPA: xanthine dehydrogenase small subunit [Bacteroidota bacterium]|nr:xanthine dehydrogenase small subunit [Bacteroidota bacterium]